MHGQSTEQSTIFTCLIEPGTSAFYRQAAAEFPGIGVKVFEGLGKKTIKAAGEAHAATAETEQSIAYGGAHEVINPEIWRATAEDALRRGRAVVQFTVERATDLSAFNHRVMQLLQESLNS